jgi:transposase InsO family protein
MSHITGAMTSKNTRIALYKAIAEHQVTPHLLNTDRGVQFFPTKTDKNGEAMHEFQQLLEELGILFVPSKVRHPQTNGKNEKFFHILDTEFDERFQTLDDFIEYYNAQRFSEALDYMTPNESYKKRL